MVKVYDEMARTGSVHGTFYVCHFKKYLTFFYIIIIILITKLGTNNKISFLYGNFGIKNITCILVYRLYIVVSSVWNVECRRVQYPLVFTYIKLIRTFALYRFTCAEVKL